MQPDMYGRTVSVLSNFGMDIYTVIDNTGNGADGTIFTVVLHTGAPSADAYNTINAMTPNWYQPPQDDSQ